MNMETIRYGHFQFKLKYGTNFCFGVGGHSGALCVCVCVCVCMCMCMCMCMCNTHTHTKGKLYYAMTTIFSFHKRHFCNM